MMSYRSCSWCHASNPMDGYPGYCPECRHRADLPRSLCDCPRCTRCLVCGGRGVDPVDLVSPCEACGGSGRRREYARRPAAP